MIFASFTHKLAIRLAERLLEILLKIKLKFFYSDNGSTAVEVGIKMAFQYFYNRRIEKKKIIAVDGAYHGHSFTANPITCAVANASLDLLLEQACENNRNRLNQRHREFLSKIQDHAMVRNPRVVGTIIAFEINTDKDTSYFNEARYHLYPYFIEKSLLIRPLGNVIYLIPPYIISD